MIESLRHFWRQHRWFRRLMTWVGLPVLAVWLLFEVNYPTCTFRYRMTAYVMTPEGLKTGTSVVQVSYRMFDNWLSGVPTLDLRARGEAVFVPIDEKRLFVVTLTGEFAERSPPSLRVYNDPPDKMQGPMDVHALPLKAFGLYWRPFDTRGLCRQVEGVRARGLPASVPLPNLPTLVVFEDVNHPESVRVVPPEGLSAVLGEGYALQKVTLAITNDKPTDTGMARFPWWERKLEEQKTLISLGSSQTLINNLLDGAFRRPGIWGNNQ